MAAMGGHAPRRTACFYGPPPPLLLLLLLLGAANGFRSEERECAFSDQLGAESHGALANELRGVVRENSTIRCSRGSRCYGLWEKRTDGELHLVKQGCWMYAGVHQECHGDRCLVTAAPSEIQNDRYRFCCCSHDLCNANFTEAPPSADTPALRPMTADGGPPDLQPLRREETVLVALVTIAVAAVLIVALFLGYRMMRGKHKQSLSSLDVMEAANTESVDLDNLKLLELIGRGRYGAVFRGCLGDRCIAVKLFSAANRQNFSNERSIYRLPLLQQHDNIACFLSGEERTAADGRLEFLILMEFYPHGSLSHFLSTHSVDWSCCCRMTHGVTRGLAFLHSELCRAEQYKPAVAHRDLTSRNVLVRADRSCVLADFGLSMRLSGSRAGRGGDEDAMAISEVGTVRYMAPEVLGGALNLRDCEAALKQVDVYALGLLYWETFRRCSDLFPGEAVPDYQLAFQAEVGNHPSFEEMQILVVREKQRPRFPEAWKENSLVLRSLKETMEDCWDQDAEARLTAQCAEERLAELTLLNTHTAVHNHRNVSQSYWPPLLSSSSSCMEDLQAGLVKNLPGDGHASSVIRTAEGAEKIRNGINRERQQASGEDLSRGRRAAAGRASLSPRRSGAGSARKDGAVTPGGARELAGGAVPSVAACLQLTRDDLEATKLDPREVNKNLRESSGESLMEFSQKRFDASDGPPADPPLHRSSRSQDAERGASGNPPPPAVHPLPKQQNLPQRPTSLQLLTKARETSPASNRLKLGKLKSSRQVETGVAKMNVVATSDEELHLVATMTKNSVTRGAAAGSLVHPVKVGGSSYSMGAPTLVINDTVGGGRTNPAGPQAEEEDKTGIVISSGEDGRLNLLIRSPDEHEPLLSREQPPATSERPGNVLSGRTSNSNNNNNYRLAPGSEGRVEASDVGSRRNMDSEAVQAPETGGPEPLRISRPCARGSQSGAEGVLAGPAEPAASDEASTDVPGDEDESEMFPGSPGHLIPSPAAVQDPSPKSKDPESISDATAIESPEPPEAPTSSLERLALETVAAVAQDSAPGTSAEASHPGMEVLQHVPAEAPVMDAHVTLQEGDALGILEPEIQVFESEGLAAPFGPDLSAHEPAAPQGLLSELPLRPQREHAKTRKPERPCSLDLSSICSSQDDSSLPDDGSLSASGEKIKRRVKTPYTLKKWRPASWVVSTDTALDPDFEFGGGGGQTSSSNALQRAGSFGFPRINQSKSSMAVFLVGGGATATAASEPDGMTCF